jgi:predicted O-methyltransferase YrrM
MKRIRLVVAAVTILGLTLSHASGQAPKPKERVERPGFNFGAPPEWDSVPLAKNDAEKKALAALDEMTKGKWYLNVTTREGRVLRQLTEMTGAKRVVEIGTSSGYSTLWLALGARAAGGKVFTHEIDPEKIKIAQENFKKAGLDDVITIIPGDAHETIKQHKEQVDLVFLDADKKGYIDYLQKILPVVRPGGVVIGHDMHGHMPDPRYIEAITKEPGLETSFLMMENFGMSVSLKKR